MPGILLWVLGVAGVVCWVIKLLGCSPSLRLFTPLLYTWFTKSFVTVVHVDNCSSSFEPRRLYVDHGIRTIVQHSLIIIDNCSAQLVVADKKWALFQQDSVANGGERRIYWLDCPEDHRQQYCHCLYCRAQIIARHFERRRVYCRPEQETRRPAGANIGPGVIKGAAFHL